MCGFFLRRAQQAFQSTNQDEEQIHTVLLVSRHVNEHGEFVYGEVEVQNLFLKHHRIR